MTATNSPALKNLTNFKASIPQQKKKYPRAYACLPEPEILNQMQSFNEIINWQLNELTTIGILNQAQFPKYDEAIQEICAEARKQMQDLEPDSIEANQIVILLCFTTSLDQTDPIRKGSRSLVTLGDTLRDFEQYLTIEKVSRTLQKLVGAFLTLVSIALAFTTGLTNPAAAVSTAALFTTGSFLLFNSHKPHAVAVTEKCEKLAASAWEYFTLPNTKREDPSNRYFW